MPGLLSIGSFSKSLAINQSRAKSQVIIYEVDGNGIPTQVIDGAKTPAFAFQYFPESLQDTKAVNYETIPVPGGALPIYQWVSSGERLINFTAVFSCDTDLLSDDTLFDAHSTRGISDRNVDIRSAIGWLRRYMLPTYKSGSGAVANSAVPVPVAPRKLFLYLPGSGLGFTGGMSDEQSADALNLGDFGRSSIATSNNGIYCHMSRCDVVINACFPSGLPRLATVDLGFREIAQYGGQVRYPSRTSEMDELVTRGGGSAPGVANRRFFGYKVDIR